MISTVIERQFTSATDNTLLSIEYHRKRHQDTKQKHLTLVPSSEKEKVFDSLSMAQWSLLISLSRQ